ncbi:MAG: CidA/LrgA family protein [Pseudomonadota bacterium]
MIHAVALLLVCQLIGEALSRALSLPVPGPVVGLTLLLAAGLALPRAAETARPAAEALLSRLALLFVPAGVGVAGQLNRLGADALPLAAALILSTLAAILAGAGAFALADRLTGGSDRAGDRADAEDGA